jgi:hypothetical protein
MERSGALSVYIKEPGPRARWIFKLIFEELLGIHISLVSDKKEFLESDLAKLNYSDDAFSNIPCIIPAGLLNQKEVTPQEIRLSEYKGLAVFYQSTSGDLPFDPFSMAFYLVSRFEEYLPHKPDKHGRFLHTQSLAYNEGFLETALVNRLALLMGDFLINSYPHLNIKPRKYEFIPTFDIDIAFAHLGKGFIRSYGSLLKLLLKGDAKEVRSRIQSMIGRARDPYNNFDLIMGECEQYGLKPLFFILAGDRSPQDNNLSLRNPLFARLLGDLSNRSEIGVHPSYRSGDEPERIAMEVARIEKVINKDVKASRQHFVRMKLPETYNKLIENNILKDYSMGYAGISGFRASIAAPFNFYDLRRDQETALRVYPFAFMDSTLSDYMGLRAEEYVASVNGLIDEVKKCEGMLSAIWHNYALSNDMGKHNSFKEIMKKAAVQ